MDSKMLSGKTALITGATSGIGEAIAKGFAVAGAKVAFCGRRKAEGEAVAAAIRDAGGEAYFEICDVGEAAALETFVRNSAAHFGKLDIALNCAGISCPDTKFADIAEEDFDRMIAINLRGVFLSMKYEIRQFLAQKTGGSIINIGSILGQVVLSSAGEYSAGHYVAAKHGVEGLTKSAAMDYGRSGIRVNSIAPGIVATAFADHLIAADVPVIRNFVAQTALGRVASAQDIVGAAVYLASDVPVIRNFVAQTALGRVASAQDIVGAAVYLASDASAYVTGTTIVVDGGYMAQ